MPGCKIIKRNTGGDIVAIYPSEVAAAQGECVTSAAIRKWCHGDSPRNGYTYEFGSERQPVHRSDTLCWSCDNACGGCSWSRSLTPVEGWDAERRDVLIQHENKNGHWSKYEESYIVYGCPEFVPDRPRGRDCSWMSEVCVECNSLNTCKTFGPICRRR